jgi:hypothetical protein
MPDLAKPIGKDKLDPAVVKAEIPKSCSIGRSFGEIDVFLGPRLSHLLSP